MYTTQGARPAVGSPPAAERGERRLSAAAGLIAGLAFGGVQLSLQLLTGTPSLPALLQDRIFGALPGAVTSDLIDRLQFWAKPLALFGIVLGQAAGVAALALLIARLLPHGGNAALHRAAPRAGALLAALLWVVPELGLLPAAGLGPLGLRVQGGGASAVSTAAAAAAAGALFAAMVLLWPAPRAEATPSHGAGTLSRRRLVASALALVTVGGAGAALQRTIATIGERNSAPAESATAGPATAARPAAAGGGFVAPPGISAELTPTPSFYVVSKNFVDPTLNAGAWSLQLNGLVDNALRLSYNDLIALPSRDAYTTLECVSNGVGGDLISNTRWTGVSLAALLDRAGAHSQATWVNFTAADGYTESLPVDAARRSTTLLAHSMDGAPLPSKHGFPVRVITAGNYGMKNPKWLTSIELASQPAQGYWEHQGWNVEAGVQTMARFDTHPRQVAAGRALSLGGVAFAGDRGISRVEVSLDGGRTWSAAELERPPSPAAWVRWSWQWTPMQPGRATLMVRAVDGKDTPQIAQAHASFPSGATGYHTIQVQVAAPAS